MFRDLFDHTYDLIQIADSTGALLYTNRAWRETLGYSEDEAKHLTIFDIIAPFHRESCNILHQRLRTGEDVGLFETAFLTKSGEAIQVEGRANLRRGPEGRFQTRGIFRNISARHLAQEDLRRFFELSPELVCVITADGSLERSNTALRHFLGLEATSPLPSNIADFIHPEDQSQARTALGRTGEARPPATVEVRCRAHDGTWRLLSWRIAQGTRPGTFYASGRDVTEERTTADALRASEARLERVIDASQFGHWEWNAATREISFSSRCASLLGCQPADLPRDIDAWFALAHPDDQPSLLTAWTDHSAGKTPCLDIEARFPSPEGSDRWLRIQGKMLHPCRPEYCPLSSGVPAARPCNIDAAVCGSAASGQPLLVSGTLQDVSTQKRAEALETARVRQTLEFQQVLLSLRNTDNSDLDAVIVLATEQCARALRVDRVSVWLFEANGESLFCRDLFLNRSGRHEAGARLPARELPSFINRLDDHEVIAVEDTESHPATREIITHHLHPLGISSLICAPISDGHKPIGVLYCSHVGPKRAWTDAEQRFVFGVTHYITLAFAAESRRVAAAAMAERESLLRTLANNLPDGAAYRLIESDDGDSRFDYVSDAITRLVGVPAPRVLEDPEALFSRVDAEDRAFFDASGHAAHVAESQFDCVVKVRMLDGQMKWLHWRSSPRRVDGLGIVWEGLIVDVTTTKLIEAELVRLNSELESRVDERTAALMESERRHRALISNLQGMVYRCATDDRRTMSFVSEGCQNLLGYRPEELVAGRIAFAEMIHPDDRAGVENELRSAMAGRHAFTLQYRLKHENGSWRTVWEQGHPVTNDEGIIEAFEGYVSDVTARVHAETAQRELENQLRQLQKTEALGTLAGGIAHDFNNALGVIMGNAQLAKLDLPDEHPASVSIDEILAASDRARDLVRQILTFSRKNDAERTPTPLGPVVQECLRLLRSTIPAMVEIHAKIDEACPPVLANATQIHQVVTNICTNAWHALPDRDGCIWITLEPSNLSTSGHAGDDTRASGPSVRLTIRDNGHGMSPQTLERIFEPFFTTKPVGKGTGLGLAVVQGIVNSHDGRISVTSTPGVGTTFAIDLPALASSVARQSPSRNATVVVGNNEHLLLVDDNPSIGRVLSQALERSGFRVSRATTPDEALEYIRSPRETFDLVITDLSMPGMSGIDLAGAIQRDRPGMPVVLLSGYADPSMFEAARESGILEVLTKPIDHGQLAACVLRHTHNEQPLQTHAHHPPCR